MTADDLALIVSTAAAGAALIRDIVAVAHACATRRKEPRKPRRSK